MMFTFIALAVAAALIVKRAGRPRREQHAVIAVGIDRPAPAKPGPHA